MRNYLKSVKVKEVSEVSPGNILISQGFWNDREFNRSVILVLEHDEGGTTGILLNKLSNMKVRQALPDLPVKDDLMFGGPFETNIIGYIHQVPSLEGSIKISDDLYWGGNIYQLKSFIDKGQVEDSKVKFFAGLVEWLPGQLSEEIRNNQWWVDEFSFNEFFEVDNSSLWAYKLIRGGHWYGMVHQVPDPFLN